MADNSVNKQTAQLGFIGLGLMGSRFFKRLHSQGWNIQGWNRNIEVSSALKSEGLEISESLTDLASTSTVILSSLRDDNAARSVYLSEDGVFSTIRSGTVVLEMSTISAEMSEVLHAEAAKRGARMIDLPVSGSTPAVEAGTVMLVAGGDQNTFNSCTPIFESIAKQWYYMGSATAGVRMKLVVNLLLGLSMEAIAEAISFGEHLGLNRVTLLDVLSKTAVVAPAFAPKFPKIKTGDYSPQFPLHLMAKDLNLVHSAASAAGATLPATLATKKSFDGALPANGDLDLCAIAPYVSELSAK